MVVFEYIFGVVVVFVIVSGVGFVVCGDVKVFIVVVGIDFECFFVVVDVWKKMIVGRFEVVGDDVVIGSVLVLGFGVGVGDKFCVVVVEGGVGVVVIVGIFMFGNCVVG